MRWNEITMKPSRTMQGKTKQNKTKVIIFTYSGLYINSSGQQNTYNISPASKFFRWHGSTKIRSGKNGN